MSQGYSPSPDVEKELQVLWESQMSKTRQRLSSGDVSGEARSFGPWFASGKLPDVWSLTQLRNALSAGGGIERVQEVLSRLLTLTPSYPELSLEALEAFSSGPQARWTTSLWKQELRGLILALTRNVDPAMRVRVDEIANSYAKRGMFKPEDFYE